ncbi:MAG: hypothetical protein ABGZ53_37920, partial [Fuerstiella sp.]
NHNASVNHPGNGRFQIVRLSNDTFELRNLDGTPVDARPFIAGISTGINYNAGGAWYVPDFLGNTPQGFVTIDVGATSPTGRVAQINDPNVMLTVDAAAAVLTVSNASLFLAGQSVVLTDDDTASESFTVASVDTAANTVTLSAVPTGSFTTAQNARLQGGNFRITSSGHGLTTGDRVRVSGAKGTGIAGTEIFKINFIDTDTFELDGTDARTLGTYDTDDGLAVWTTNLITDASNPLAGEIVITSIAHQLTTGDRVRILDVNGNTSAQGTFSITRLDADTFSLNGSQPNGAYTGGGHWIELSEMTPSGDTLEQMVSGNSITGNRAAGVYVDLETGTAFSGDIIRNDISGNTAKGIHIESHSYGVGETLPLATPTSLPGARDISFDVNVGSGVETLGNGVENPQFNGVPLDGNILFNNGEAGVAIEVLDLGTGSFRIINNVIRDSTDDLDPQTAWAGDGIFVTLESDIFPVDSSALLFESIIRNNDIGVDSHANDGHGMTFLLTQRTRIQDLEVIDNFFGNNKLDGFHFRRTENGSLNSVILEGNRATNSGSDGFDLYAENSVDDRLDFKIRQNSINNNAEYGVRINVQAAARIEVD